MGHSFQIWKALYVIEISKYFANIIKRCSIWRKKKYINPTLRFLMWISYIYGTISNVFVIKGYFIEVYLLYIHCIIYAIFYRIGAFFFLFFRWNMFIRFYTHARIFLFHLKSFSNVRCKICLIFAGLKRETTPIALKKIWKYLNGNSVSTPLWI